MNATPSKQGKIMVIGGYGAVGKLLSAQLAALYPGALIIAGRDGKRAKDLSNRIPGTTSVTLDAHDPDSYAQIFRPENAIRVVVSCLELPPDSQLAQDILGHGIHFTELTATYAAHKKLLALQKTALQHASTAIVGVGLMPGLSNIMAQDAARGFDHIDRIEINLMLGLGDTHGPDAVRWTLQNIASTYTVTLGNEVKSVKSFTEPHKTLLIDEERPREFYRFDFSDQHMLAASIKAEEINSRLAFDSRYVTKILGWLRKIDALAFVKKMDANKIHALMQTFSLGTDQWALQIEACGAKDEELISRKILARGHGESKATAIVAAYVTSLLYENKIAAGIHPIDTVAKANEVYTSVRHADISVISR